MFRFHHALLLEGTTVAILPGQWCSHQTAGGLHPRDPHVEVMVEHIYTGGQNGQGCNALGLVSPYCIYSLKFVHGAADSNFQLHYWVKANQPLSVMPEPRRCIRYPADAEHRLDPG